MDLPILAATQEDGDDACVLCGKWKCRCSDEEE